MPLVVPETTADERSTWATRLLGKKIGDSHDQVTFAKSDLPQKHRIIKPDSMSTADYDENRLNVHVDKDGTVHDVKHG